MARTLLRFASVSVVGALVALAACAPQPPAVVLLKADGVTRLSVQTGDYDAQLEALNVSARKLGDALLTDGGDATNGNVVVSPASLLIALGMLRAGTSGATAAEMDAVLGLPAEGRDEAMNALLTSLEKYDGDPGSVDEDNPPRKPVMHAANGLFVERSIPTGQDFLATLGRHYGTGVYPVSFQDEAATKPAIDRWVSDNTGGRIKEAPAGYDPKNTFSLVNALYFAAAWQAPFSANDTYDRPFTKAGGEVVNVPTMGETVSMKYAVAAGWKAVDLPYAEGFVMRLVLPDAGTPGSDSPAAVSAEVLAGVEKSLAEAPSDVVTIALPKWDHKTTFDLRKVFASLGLKEMLATESDFDAIQGGMRLTQAAQAANIKVAEKGTVAAAVTQINATDSAGTASEREIILDHPFHYQIVHSETGLPLFTGWVADPR
ncbi:serpin family protein [Paenarthrobacter sp. NPDC090522]|uniref:serpin family protein n=1 Tax=Paenarthrobacter sp. NPDC090522 TaxID=3364383 RepID=UPI00380DA180